MAVNGSNLTTVEKFAKVMDEMFDNIGIIISDLNAAGKTHLHAVLVQAFREYILSHDKRFLIDSFIENSQEYWIDIKNKNEVCLLQNAPKILGSFSDRPEFDSVKIIFSDQIDEEAKSYVWACLFSLVKLSIHHVYKERGTSVSRSINNEGKSVLTISYKNKNLYPQVNLRKQNEVWDLKLF